MNAASCRSSATTYCFLLPPAVPFPAACRSFPACHSFPAYCFLLPPAIPFPAVYHSFPAAYCFLLPPSAPFPTVCHSLLPPTSRLPPSRLTAPSCHLPPAHCSSSRVWSLSTCRSLRPTPQRVHRRHYRGRNAERDGEREG